MSKVKYLVNNKRDAAKAHRSLRIADTKQKKTNRINNVHNKVYSYSAGYWIEDTKRQYEYEYIAVPERIIPAKRYFDLYFPEKIIPAHKRKVIKNVIEIEVPTRLMKINFGNAKKYHRKKAARKVRQYTGDLNNSDYKKVYDVWWSLL